MFGTTQADTSSCENMNKRTDVPTGSRSCICYDPTPNKTGCSLTMVLLENLGRKIVLFPSFFSIFFFLHGECLVSPTRFFLNYFLLYLFVLSLNRIFYLVSEEILAEHVLKSLPHKTSIWLLVVLADMSACALCGSICTPLSSVFMLLDPHCIVISL